MEDINIDNDSFFDIIGRKTENDKKMNDDKECIKSGKNIAKEHFFELVTNFIEYKLSGLFKYRNDEYRGLLSGKDKEEENENKDPYFIRKTFSINKFYKIFLEEFFAKYINCYELEFGEKEKNLEAYKVRKKKIIKGVSNSLQYIFKVFVLKLQLILSRNERKNNGKIVLFSFPNHYREGEIKKVKGLKFEFGDNKKHQVNFDIGKNLNEVNQILELIKSEIEESLKNKKEDAIHSNDQK